MTMTNKVVRVKARCASCMSYKSRFLKQKRNKKVVGDIIKHVDILFNVLKNTKNVYSKMIETKNGTTMTLSECAICGTKKSRFVKDQEAIRLVSNLGIKTPLSKIPLLGEIFFNLDFI